MLKQHFSSLSAILCNQISLLAVSLLSAPSSFATEDGLKRRESDEEEEVLLDFAFRTLVDCEY